MTQLKTTHWGLISIAAMQASSLLCGDGTQTGVLESLQGGQVFAAIMTAADFVHRHLKGKYG